MRVPTDLHEDDLAMRIALADELREIREARGIDTGDLAAILGVTRTAVRALERRTSWEAPTIMRYARPIGRRIEFYLDGLEVPEDDDVISVIYAAIEPSSPEQEDKAHWRRICNDLRRIRRANHTAVSFARTLGVNENAVHYWEANPDGSSIISAQRHARGLGGRLGYRLHEISGAACIPAPRQAA
jgi:DNA-binding transcriptional regulator YiaG